jgi:hypothetical protein
MQAERRALEQAQLKELCLIAVNYPQEIENITPERFGFVCSNRDWAFFWKRMLLQNAPRNAINAHEILTRAA